MGRERIFFLIPQPKHTCMYISFIVGTHSSFEHPQHMLNIDNKLDSDQIHKQSNLILVAAVSAFNPFKITCNGIFH